MGLLAGLAVLVAAPAASAQVPGLPPIFPPSQEEPEKPKPKPEEPEQQPEQEPKPKPKPQEQPPPPPPPPPQPQPGPGGQQEPPPPQPVILKVAPTDTFLGRTVEVVGRARPNVPVWLMVDKDWGLSPGVVTTRTDANGSYTLRFRPSGNTTVRVRDGSSVSRPSPLFVVPRMELMWQQKRGRLEILLYDEGEELASSAGARVHFYGFASRRARTGRRLGGQWLVTAQTKDGTGIVGAYLRMRRRSPLQGLAYCVEWGRRYERPEWTRACGRRTMRF